MKLTRRAPLKLRLLAIEIDGRANTFSTFSDDEKWQTRAGQMDRAANLLREAAGLIEAAWPHESEN